MHSYSINSRQRENVTRHIAVISFLLGIILAILDIGEILVAFLGIGSSDLPWIVVCEAFNTLMPVGFFQIIMCLYRHVLWRRFPFNKFHDIPDLNGIWEGELESALKDRPRKIKVVIRQNWDNILVKTETGSGTKAVSFNASISVQESVTTLSYAFENIRLPKNYIGFNSLRLQDSELIGEYFTNKSIRAEDTGDSGLTDEVRRRMEEGMGSKGTVRLKRVT